MAGLAPRFSVVALAAAGQRCKTSIDDKAVAGYSPAPYIPMSGAISPNPASASGSVSAKAVQAVFKGIDVPLSGQKLDALIAFASNIGPENFRTPTVRRVINALDFDAVPAAFRLFNKITVDGKKVISKVLVRRREAEIARLWNLAA